MERITIFVRTQKGSGSINLRFRLIDGRDVQLYHKSQIKANLEDLKKFNPDGTVRSRVSIYNEDLHSMIASEIALMSEAYAIMKKKGTSMATDSFETAIEALRAPEEKTVYENKSFMDRFRSYVEAGYRDGLFGLSRYKHDKGTILKLERFLKIKRKSSITYTEWDEALLMEFREFVRDEYKYVDKYKSIYSKLNDRETPKERRKANTVANEMQVLKSFFTELEDTEEITRSPFRKINRERRRLMTKKKYDDPIFLRKEEFAAIRDFAPKKTLVETKEAFLLHCALGCRIGDFQKLTMDNVGVSEEGIPYVHYLPQKTKGTQKDNSEVITPLVRYAFDIIMRTRFDMPILKYPSGKSGYNKKIKQLLKDAGIDRKVTEYDEESGENRYLPLYEASSSKLARKTHVDMMSKVQVNMYAAGLHRKGSDAVNRYTMLEIKDRFDLMNAAFEQKDFRVGKNLKVIKKRRTIVL